MKNKKVFLVGGENYEGYISWLKPLGYEITNNLKLTSLLFFCGGEDISCDRYNEKTGSMIHSNSTRDNYEFDIFEKSKDIPKASACRGGQLLTVANGYRIIQHMSHPSYHDIQTYEGYKITGSSSHHNQFYLNPNGLSPASKFKLIAWCNKLSPIHLDGNDEDYQFPDDYKEPEIVAYQSKTHGNSLAIQMHPEYFPLNHPTVKYCQDLLGKFLEDKL